MSEAQGERKRSREKRDPLATRQALLDAAAALFSKRGYDGVPIEDVAARAGVNKALISYHFGGKRGLYVAVLTSGFALIAERLRAVEDEKRDAREVLRDMLRAFDALRRERPDFPSLFVREVLSSGIEPAVLPKLLEVIGVVRRLAEQGARQRVFRRVDPLMLHFGLVGSLVFFLATEPARQRAVEQGRLPVRMPDFPAFLSYVEGLTLRGLAPDEAPARGRRTNVRRAASKGARA